MTPFQKAQQRYDRTEHPDYFSDDSDLEFLKHLIRYGYSKKILREIKKDDRRSKRCEI